MPLRTLYLQGMLSIGGRYALNGRALYDRFSQISEEALLGHAVYSDEDNEKVKDPRLKSDIVSQTLLREFRPNVVFIEGGLFLNDAGHWKFPREMATEFCNAGGVLIVADADANELHNNKGYYRQAADFFKANAQYGDGGESSHPVYGADETRNWRGGRQILCNSSKMTISEWVRPIYEDVPEVLVALPVSLTVWESVVASCNSDTTGTLHLDIWEDQIHPCLFAAAAQIGSGFAVLIAGTVTHDGWLEGCPHNSRWLTNIADFFVGAANEDLARRRSHRRSPHLLFLSHRSIDKPIVSTVANSIKRRGVNVWFDEENLIPSLSLTAEINKALGKMTHFVLFWSSNCEGAPWVERELNSAVAILIERSVPLLIVRLDEAPVPPIVSDLFRIEARNDAPEVIGGRVVDAVSKLSQRSGK